MRLWMERQMYNIKLSFGLTLGVEVDYSIRASENGKQVVKIGALRRLADQRVPGKCLLNQPFSVFIIPFMLV